MQTKLLRLWQKGLPLFRRYFLGRMRIEMNILSKFIQTNQFYLYLKLLGFVLLLVIDHPIYHVKLQ